ncbi:peptidoglycan recognition family protein [Nocardiopsis mangrovi]|uniref:Peptidoglycan recognition family protein n=1 Tax=Nocardiopsis mangrovi TaxID=1179818 RepID=A0ABV9DZS2_9ACTN
MCVPEGQDSAVSRRTVLRGAAVTAGAALLAGAADLGGAPDALAATAPRVYTRAEWGARAAKSGAQVLANGPDRIVVHHTATSNSTDYSTSHAAALSRSIQRFHMDTNGWADIGQQLTISRGGHIMEGRNRTLPAIRDGGHVVGAHVADHNSHALGIENEGTYTSSAPTDALLESLIATCAWLCAVYGLNPAQAIVGHRDYNVTACPGDGLYKMLPELRSGTSARLRTLGLRVPQRAEDVPAAHLPGFPAVPSDERVAPFQHGPAVGDLD